MKKILITIIIAILLNSCGELKEKEEEILLNNFKQEKNIEVKNKSISSSIKKNKIKILGEIDFFYKNHIKLYLVGGKLTKIINLKTKEEVIFNDFNKNSIEKNKAYSDINIFEEYYLPKGETYKINFKKYKQYPALEIYVKIPIENNLLEVINYKNIATNSDDETLAELIIGNNNNNKEILRIGESNVKFDHNGIYKILMKK